MGAPKGNVPGFLIGRTGGDQGISKRFPDVSTCEGLTLVAKSSIPFEGFSVSIADQADNGYKARFAASLNKVGTVRIPFKDFTQLYDSSTGNPIKTCQDNPVNCVFFYPETLQKMRSSSPYSTTPRSPVSRGTPYSLP